MLWRLLRRRAASRAEGLVSLEDSVWFETGKLHILGMFWRRMDGWRRTRRGTILPRAYRHSEAFFLFSFPLEQQQMCILLLLVLPWDPRSQDCSQFLSVDYGCVVGQLILILISILQPWSWAKGKCGLRYPLVVPSAACVLRSPSTGTVQRSKMILICSISIHACANDIQHTCIHRSAKKKMHNPVSQY
jgi:hypothetical protein